MEVRLSRLWTDFEMDPVISCRRHTENENVKGPFRGLRTYSGRGTFRPGFSRLGAGKLVDYTDLPRLSAFSKGHSLSVGRARQFSIGLGDRLPACRLTYPLNAMSAKHHVPGAARQSCSPV